MNQRIYAATVKRYPYDRHHQPQMHLADFIAAYDLGRRLKTLEGLTPCEAICKTWQEVQRDNQDASACCLTKRCSGDGVASPRCSLDRAVVWVHSPVCGAAGVVISGAVGGRVNTSAQACSDRQIFRRR